MNTKFFNFKSYHMLWMFSKISIVYKENLQLLFVHKLTIAILFNAYIILYVFHFSYC